MTDAERKLAAILSADVVGYSRLMAEDEAGTVRRLTAYRDQIATLAREHRGRVVDSPGDNVLAEFPTATDAVSCAVEIQGVLNARNAPLPEGQEMEFRIGVHLGEIRVEGERIYGDGVNIASRLEGLAEPGGICVSSTVHEQVEKKLNVALEDLGERTLKNIPRPIHVYGVKLLLPEAQPESRPLPGQDDLTVPGFEGRPAIAVLAFDNLSRDPDQEYFSDGLTEDIITALSRFKDLFVIARNSTFRYRGQAVDVRQLNKELGARYVLEGSVQRAESTLRVTAQLLDAKDGTHLWAETYDRELSASNIFDVQDEITAQVAATIASSSGVIFRARFAEIREKPTERLDAYESVLKTLAYETGGPNAPEHATLRDALERAVTSDPSYSDAWAWLSALYLDEDRYNYNPRPNPLDRALDAAQRAVALDPTSQVAYNVLAIVHFQRQELDAFLADAERALALNPKHALTLASLCARFGQVGDERGNALVKKAMKLDPFLPTFVNIPIAAHHFYRGEYEEALAATRRVSVPGFPFFTQIFLAASYAEPGRQDDATVAVEELLRLRPDYTIEKQTEWMRKNNLSEERIVRMTAALRKAGLPE